MPFSLKIEKAKQNDYFYLKNANFSEKDIAISLPYTALFHTINIQMFKNEITSDRMLTKLVSTAQHYI